MAAGNTSRFRTRSLPAMLAAGVLALFVAWLLWRPSAPLPPPELSPDSRVLILVDDRNAGNPLSSIEWEVDWENHIGLPSSDGVVTFTFDTPAFPHELSTEFYPQLFIGGTRDTLAQLAKCGERVERSSLSPGLAIAYDDLSSASALRSVHFASELIKLSRAQTLSCELPGNSVISQNSVRAQLVAPRISLVTVGGSYSDESDNPFKMDVVLNLPTVDWVQESSRSGLGTKAKTVDPGRDEWDAAKTDSDETDFSEQQAGSILYQYTQPLGRQAAETKLFLSGVLLGAAAGAFIAALEIGLSSREERGSAL